MTTHTTLFYRFGVSLAIGFLVGLQREYAYGGTEEELSMGVRTLALVGLLGCSSALIAEELLSAWGFLGIALPVGALIVVAHFVGAWPHEDTGLTTEMATLLTLAAGAFCYWDHLALAAAIGVTTTLVLSLKPEMHAFAQRLTREDVYAILKFAVITVIVLPVLPNRSFGPPPLDVLNPHEMWLMVVLISGISFLGYVLIKIVGPRQGIPLTGILGGIVSSTPVTFTFSQRSQEERELAKPFALAITVAWAMTYLRIVIQVAIINAELLKTLWPPMAAALAVALTYSAYLHLSQRTERAGEVAFSNPFELGTALKFGLLYGFVLLVSKAAQVYVGEVGVYLSSAITGLSGAHAVTLSMARLSAVGDVSLNTGGRAVVIGAMATTVAKGSVVLTLGSQELRQTILPGLLLMLAAGIGVAFLM
ncbi:MAG: MgtC/SapB family protein [Anaerolineae bacterium]